MPATNRRALVAAAALTAALAGCGGAAPEVPHAVSSQLDTSCLTCHRDGIGGATRTPHAENPNCVACHAPVGTVDVGAARLLPPAGR